MTGGGGPALFAVFLGMGAVTYLPRLLPLMLLVQRRLPVRVLRFLELVPVAVLAALVAPLVSAPGGSLDVSLDNLTLVASLPTVVVALLGRNLMLTVVAGIVVMIVLRVVV